MRLILLWRMYDSFADIWMLMQCFRNKNQIIPIKCSKLKAIVHGNDYIFSFLIQFRFFFFFFILAKFRICWVLNLFHICTACTDTFTYTHSTECSCSLCVCVRVCMWVWVREREQNTYSGKIEKEKSQIKWFSDFFLLPETKLWTDFTFHWLTNFSLYIFVRINCRETVKNNLFSIIYHFSISSSLFGFTRIFAIVSRVAKIIFNVSVLEVLVVDRFFCWFFLFGRFVQLVHFYFIILVCILHVYFVINFSLNDFISLFLHNLQNKNVFCCQPVLLAHKIYFFFILLCVIPFLIIILAFW